MTTPVPPHLSDEERALWEKMEAATLGPWETGIMAAGGFAPDDLAGDHYVVASPSATPSRPNAIRCAAICGPTDDPNGGQSLADAEFIAAANPAVMRSLLTALSTEREAGERDKARLDWLGDDGPSTPYLHRSHLDYWDGWVVIDPEQNEVLSSHGTDFRAAIDAARETFPDAMRAAPSTETPHA